MKGASFRKLPNLRLLNTTFLVRFRLKRDISNFSALIQGIFYHRKFSFEKKIAVFQKPE